jgi:hypothetical protein
VHEVCGTYEVHRDGFTPTPPIAFPQRPNWTLNTRRIDHHVYAAEVTNGRVNAPAHVGTAPDISRNCEDSGLPTTRDCRDGPSKIGLAPRYNRYV